MLLPVCDPLIPVKSGAQQALESSLNRPNAGYSTLTMANKTGDIVVPANVHIRFYNCVFDAFDATQGNNTFYFEQCTFNQTPVMTDVVAIAAGTIFKDGARVIRTKIDLIPHEAPNLDTVSNTTSPTIKTYCQVNNTFRCEDHSVLKSIETIFEWLEESFTEIADELIRSMGILREAAEVCGKVSSAITGIVAWANKSILDLVNFSKYESLLDKFINIPFTILNMINGCVAKMTSIAFGVLDSALSSIFSCAASIVNLFNQINSLINTIKSLKTIPSRIAALANKCYLRIMDTPNLLATKVAFLLDTQSRVELMLNQRIMAVNGAIADVSNSSKMVLRNCGVVTSPMEGNLIPLVKVSTNSLIDFSRIKFLSTASAPLFLIESGGKVKLNTISKVESTAVEGSDPLVKSTEGTVEAVGIDEIVSNCTVFNTISSSLLLSVKTVTLNSSSAYLIDADNSYIA